MRTRPPTTLAPAANTPNSKRLPKPWRLISIRRNRLTRWAHLRATITLLSFGVRRPVGAFVSLAQPGHLARKQSADRSAHSKEGRQEANTILELGSRPRSFP